MLISRNQPNLKGGAPSAGRGGAEGEDLSEQEMAVEEVGEEDEGCRRGDCGDGLRRPVHNLHEGADGQEKGKGGGEEAEGVAVDL